MGIWYLDFLRLFVILLASLLGFACIYYIILLLKDAVNYLKEKIRYGKIEGTIIDKDKEIAIGMPMMYPYMFYVIIQKEKDGKVVTRRLDINEFFFDTLEIGDTIKKENFSIVKL
ncbi:MAG: hypothetical protein RR922_06850 [Clostridia bacterium]